MLLNPLRPRHLENPDMCTTEFSAVTGTITKYGALLYVKNVKYRFTYWINCNALPFMKCEVGSQNSIQRFPSVIYSGYSSHLLNTCTVPLLGELFKWTTCCWIIGRRTEQTMQAKWKFYHWAILQTLKGKHTDGYNTVWLALWEIQRWMHTQERRLRLGA